MKIYDDINKSKTVLISLFVFWIFYTLTSPYMDEDDGILKGLKKNKKYKLKELNLKSLKYLNKFNFIMPYDVKFNKNEINYYLISKPYFLRFFDYTQIPQNYYNIVDSYVLCKLPMQKDVMYSSKYIGRERHPKSEFWAKFYAYEINE